MTTLSRSTRQDAGAQPPTNYAAYASTQKRAPRQAPIRLEQTLSEVTGPRFDPKYVSAADADLSRWNGAEALSERIVVTGRVLDEDARPIRGTFVEPLDPHFCGVGRVMTDERGAYRFLTVKPGAYPWRNHYNAWRPQHIHFSLFGPSFITRLVTQMYFPGDPAVLRPHGRRARSPRG